MIAPTFSIPTLMTLQGEILEHSPQLTRVRFPIEAAWLDAFGGLQSGMLASMFDTVFDLCISAHMRRFSTLEFSVHCFRAIHKGPLIVDGTVLRAGHSTVSVEAIAWDMANELCAKGIATKLFVG